MHRAMAQTATLLTLGCTIQVKCCKTVVFLGWDCLFLLVFFDIHKRHIGKELRIDCTLLQGRAMKASAIF